MAWELATFGRSLLEADGKAVQALAMGEGALAGVDVEFVEPGEAVRITHVLDVVEPRVRPDGRSAFPTAGRAGEGRTNRLDGVVIVSCLDFPDEERPLHEQEALIDLAGPGASLTPFSGMTNVVLTFQPAGGRGNEEIEAAARRVALAAAERLAAPTLAAEP